MTNEEKELSYWPTKEEYNPGLTVEDYINILKDEELTNENAFDMIRKMYYLGGESTCIKLSLIFGDKFEHYRSTGTNYGERICSKYKIEKCYDVKDDEKRYFPVIFVGRWIDNGKYYSWKMRDELYEAFKQVLAETSNYMKLNELLKIENDSKDYSEGKITLNRTMGKAGGGCKDEWLKNVGRPINERCSFSLGAYRTDYKQIFHDGNLLIILIQLDTKDTWLLAAVVRIEKTYKDEDCDIEIIDEYVKYFGKVILKLDSKAQRFDNKISNCLDKCEVITILEEEYKGENIDGIVKDNNLDKKNEKMENNKDISLNTILYGPPGTGKTYNTITYAVAIIENKSVKDIEEKGRDYVVNEYNECIKNGQIEFTTFHQSYGYEEFIEGIRPVFNSNVENGNKDIQYEIKSGVFKSFCEKAQNTDKKHVFIIDEINRGNISKIFGELITLIEHSKRIGAKEELKVKLPYSQKSFGIPNNVYIIGTMNTADRSIAMIDTALRRRFNFIEMQPDSSVLKGVNIEGLSISTMLDNMNKKIRIKFDREHTIGHAYFMSLKNEDPIENLACIFKNNIIPLLQEYFYEDYEKIRLILGDNKKVDEKLQFIKKIEIDQNDLFGDYEEDEDSYYYEINEEAFNNIESYKKI